MTNVNDSLNRIPIYNSDKFALVSAEDKVLISYSWSLDSHGYARRRTSDDWVYMHTDILGTKEGFLPDHINRDPLDNRRPNLRFVTRGQNVVNSPKAKNLKATSKYKGVSWAKDRNKWVANICYNDKDINLGRFDSEEAAALAYNVAAVKYFGEVAFLNTVSDSGMVGGLDASTGNTEEAVNTASPTSPTIPAVGGDDPNADPIPTTPYPVVSSEIMDNKLNPYALDVALRVYEDAFPDANDVTFDGVKAAIEAYQASLMPVMSKVSLNTCLKALFFSLKKKYGMGVTCLGRVKTNEKFTAITFAGNIYLEDIEAVLDAAGVAYVD